MRDRAWLGAIVFCCALGAPCLLSAEEPVLYALRGIRLEGVSGQLVLERKLMQVRLDLVRRGRAFTVLGEGESPAERDTLSIRLADIEDRLRPLIVDAAALKQLVTRLAAAYREAGYAAVRADILQGALDRVGDLQRGGVLVVRVVEGRVESLRVRRPQRPPPPPPSEASTEDAEASESQDDGAASPPTGKPLPYRHRLIASVSPVQAGDPVRLETTQHFLEQLNRRGTRSVGVALAPGRGADRLTMEYIVADPEPWSVFIQHANTGTEQTTDWRQTLGVTRRGLFESGDALSLTYVTAEFDALHAAMGAYEFPLDDLDYGRGRLHGGWSRYDASQVGFAGAGFRGEDAWVGVEGTWQIWRQGALFVDWVAGIEYRDTRVDNEIIFTTGETQFLLPSTGLRFERRDAEGYFAGAVLADINLPDTAGTDKGEIEELGKTDADRSWWRLRFELDDVRRLQHAPLGDAGTAELAARLRAQYIPSDRRVPPSFSQTAGGFHSVRGYPESFVSGDNGVVGSLEYRLHAGTAAAGTWGSRWTARAFVDAGWVDTNDALGFEPDATLVGAGVGLEWQPIPQGTTRADVGWALHEQTNGAETVSAGSARLHLLFTLRF